MGQREEIIAKEEILKKIRQSLLVSKENPFDNKDFSENIFKSILEIPEMIFAKEFINSGGNFVFCENPNDFFNQFNNIIKQKNWNKFRITKSSIKKFLNIADENIIEPDLCDGEEVSITQCDFLSARTGSILISSTICPDRLAWSFCNTHIVFATSNQVVENLTTAYDLLRKKYNEDYPSIISVINGTSKTTNIEGNLVFGAHGPQEIYLFLIDKIN